MFKNIIISILLDIIVFLVAPFAGATAGSIAIFAVCFPVLTTFLLSDIEKITTF